LKPGTVPPEAPYGAYIGGDNITLTRCEVYRNGGYGLHVYTDSPETVNNVTLSFNNVYDNDQTSGGATAGIVVSSGSGHRVYGNVVRGGRSNHGGIQLGSGCTSCLIYNNTIYGVGAQGMYWIGNGTVRNNIVQNSGVNNILKDGGSVVTSSDNSCSGTGGTTNCTDGDPRLADAPNADFRLCTGAGTPHPSCAGKSTLIDTGFDVSSIVTTDIAGTARPIGSAMDIGAFESGETSPAEPTPILVAQYSFDDVATDSSGNANHGSVSGATYGVGKYNSALVFDGINDVVTVADSATLDVTHGFTLEAWVLPTSVATDAAIIAKNPDSKYFLHASIDGFCGDNGVLGGFSETTSNGTACYATALTTGIWTHLALTYDRSNLILYKDGVAATTAAASTFLTASAGTLQIGGSGFGEFFTGRIDEVRIYNYARSAVQVATDMITPIGALAPSTRLQVGTGTLKLGASATALQIGE
jgi:hypothetical protein